MATITNLILQSQALATTPWQSNGGSATNNIYVAPDSTTTATRIIGAATNAGRYNGDATIVTTIGVHYTYSGYLQYQSGATNWKFGTDSGAVGLFYIVVNVQTGELVSTSGTLVGYDITSLGSGWYRYSVTFVATRTKHPMIVYSQNTTNTSTIAAWGMQAQTGDVATTYIPTTTSQVTVTVTTSSGNFLQFM